jgi:hypothetical protein
MTAMKQSFAAWGRLIRLNRRVTGARTIGVASISIRTENFVAEMANHFPSLGPVLTVHKEDNFRTILPHVFLGDVTRWVVGLVAVATAAEILRNRKQLTSVLSYLEDAYNAGDEELQELISVSFLENLPRPGERGSEVRQMVGSALSAQLKVIG